MITEKTDELVRLYEETTGTWKFVKKDGLAPKSVEMIEKAFSRLGLSKNEVRVYLYLARYGERKASEVSDALCLHRTETYRILRDLEKQGMVSSAFEKPLKFVATPFEKAIDLLIEAKKLRIRLLEQKKKSLVDAWLSLPHPNMKPIRKEVFQILEGQEQIDLKANEILEKARNEIVVFAPESDLPRLYYSGFFDRLEKCVKKDVDVMLLTNNSPKSRFFAEKMKLHMRYSSSNVDDLPGFVIADKEQLLLSITNSDEDCKENGHGRRGRITALSTNYGAFIRILGKLFGELWGPEKPIEVTGIALR